MYPSLLNSVFIYRLLSIGTKGNEHTLKTLPDCKPANITVSLIQFHLQVTPYQAELLR